MSATSSSSVGGFSTGSTSTPAYGGVRGIVFEESSSESSVSLLRSELRNILNGEDGVLAAGVCEPSV